MKRDVGVVIVAGGSGLEIVGVRTIDDLFRQLFHA